MSEQEQWDQIQERARDLEQLRAAGLRAGLERGAEIFAVIVVVGLLMSLAWFLMYAGRAQLGESAWALVLLASSVLVLGGSAWMLQRVLFDGESRVERVGRALSEIQTIEQVKAERAR